MSDELKTKQVYIVYTNTDLTEGRGHQVPIHACELKATAKRLAKGKGVMGSDAEVREQLAVWVFGAWCLPVRIEQPTADDTRAQERDDKRAAALAKAKTAGLTADDLRDLGVIP